MEKIRRIKWATPQFVQLEEFIIYKFPAITLISAPVGTSYGNQYVCFIKLGGKLPRKFKKKLFNNYKKRKKANKQIIDIPQT